MVRSRLDEATVKPKGDWCLSVLGLLKHDESQHGYGLYKCMPISCVDAIVKSHYL